MPRIIAVVMFSLVCATGSAQQVREGGDTARFQAAIQQLTLERSELQAENGDLEAELETARAALAASNAEIASLRAESARLAGSLQQSSVASDRSDQLVAQLRAQQEELVAEFRRTIEVLRATELELNETSAALASVESERDQCVVNNLSLYRTGIEVLDRYEEKGCFESARQQGPFLQLKRVELENLIDQYRWQLEDELLPENTPAE